MTTLNNFFSADIKLQIWVQNPDGSWRKGNSSNSTVNQLVEVITKNGTTGRFIPGVYRVTPYDANSLHKKWVSPTFVTEARYNNTNYKLEWSGPWALLAFDWYYNNSPLITSNTSGLSGYALQKAYSKLGQNDVGLGEALGELKETLQMLKSPLKSLRDYLSTPNRKPNFGLSPWERLKDISKWLKSGRRIWQGKPISPRKKDSIASVATDSWLEIRYGIIPLWSTINDLIEMAGKQYPFDPNAIYSCKANTKRRVDWELPKRVNSYSLYGSLSTFGKGRDDVTCHASVQYQLLGSLTTADRLGLAPKFLPELAWELTTCSFVVDWWFDIGTWLGSMRIEPKIKILGNTVSTKVARTVTQTAIAGHSLPFYCTKHFELENSASYTQAYFKRVCNQSLPVLPTWKPEFKSVWHLIDALSLIHQRLK